MFGVCVNSRQRCLDGVFRACDDAAYGPDFEPIEVSCDGLDNDCDGLVDSRPVVELANQASGPWFFLATASGFALIDHTDAGTELRWLTQELQPIAVAQTTTAAIAATSFDDSLILGALTDAGVVLMHFDPDGGSSSRTVSEWPNPDALELASEVAAVRINGEVQVSLGANVPLSLGADTDGTLRLSQTGGTLAWAGGITRTADLTLLRTGSVGPLIALLELDTTIISGVPLAQPGQPVFFPDLLAASPARTLTSFPVPQLNGIQATNHRGRVLLVGLEGTNALWVVNERGTQRRMLPLESVRVAPTNQPMAAFAWEYAGTISAVRRCAP
jgi:hypothetical protein